MARPVALPVAATDQPALRLQDVVRNLVVRYLARLRSHPQVNSVSGLHDLRVALRRMRVALGYIRRQDAEARRLEHALAAETRAMGEARDEDVFVATTLPLVLKRSGGKSRELMRAAASVHKIVRARLRARLASASWLALQRDLAAWAATRTKATDTPPIAKFARERVRKLHRRLLAHASGLQQQSWAQQHATRKRARRLRYTVESFAGQMSHPKRVERYLRCVQAIQDALGAARDAAQGVAKLEQLGASGRVLAAARSNLAIASAANLKKARRALRQVRRLKIAVQR